MHVPASNQKLEDKSMHLHQSLFGFINLFTSKISIVILLNACHMVTMMLCWRIWFWIN